MPVNPDWIYYGVMLVLGFLGLIVAVVGLPGIWLIPLLAIVFAVLTDAAYIGVWGIAAIVAIGAAAEIIESTLSSVAVGSLGGSKRGMAAAMLGGITGAILGTPLIPIPVLGTIIGGCIGVFVATATVEILWVKRNPDASLRISAGAVVGRLIGLLVKLMAGGVMLTTLAVLALPVPSRHAPPGAPAPIPDVPAEALPTTAPREAVPGDPATEAFPGARPEVPAIPEPPAAPKLPAVPEPPADPPATVPAEAEPAGVPAAPPSAP